jgi:hypothetical protein
LNLVSCVLTGDNQLLFWRVWRECSERRWSSWLVWIDSSRT